MNKITQVNQTPKTPKKKALSKPDVFGEFVLWMSTAEPLRKIKTQHEFADKFGVSQDTLTDWKKRGDFWQEVNKQWDKWGKEKTSNVMQKFYQTIIQGGSTADFKLWFQYFLDWREKNESKIDMVTPSLESNNPSNQREEAGIENVWQLESGEQKQASNILGEMVEVAEKDKRIREFLEEVFEDDWETIKERVTAEGSTWYLWWRNRVDKFIRMQKEENNLAKVKK